MSYLCFSENITLVRLGEYINFRVIDIVLIKFNTGLDLSRIDHSFLEHQNLHNYIGP